MLHLIDHVAFRLQLRLNERLLNLLIHHHLTKWKHVYLLQDLTLTLLHIYFLLLSYIQQRRSCYLRCVIISLKEIVESLLLSLICLSFLSDVSLTDHHLRSFDRESIIYKDLLGKISRSSIAIHDLTPRLRMLCLLLTQDLMDILISELIFLILLNVSAGLFSLIIIMVVCCTRSIELEASINRSFLSSKVVLCGHWLSLVKFFAFANLWLILRDLKPGTRLLIWIKGILISLSW